MRVLELLENVCSKHGLESCRRLEEIKARADVTPPGLLLTALLGVIDSMFEEAKNRGLDDVLALIEDARRDVEWMLREAAD